MSARAVGVAGVRFLRFSIGHVVAVGVPPAGSWPTRGTKDIRRDDHDIADE